MKKFRLLLVGIATCVLLPLAAAEPVFADTAPPAPLSSIIPDPLKKWLPANGPVTNAFMAWYAAQPAQAIAFLQFLTDNPAAAALFQDWVMNHPDQAAAFFSALAVGPQLPAVQKVRE
jgi:hypothetical protein